MKPFRFVYYVKIDLKLDGMMRVGDGDDDGIGMAANSDGEYIIPATSVAGSIRHAILRSDGSGKIHRWTSYFGTKEKDSLIYFYDAVCSNAYVEKRTGVQIDSHYGVAEDKLLYNTYYLADGLTTSLRLQAFAENETELEDLKAIAAQITRSISSGKVTFGAKTGIGAGRFIVTGTKSLDLNLGKENDKTQYLRGVSACFDACATDETLMNEVAKAVPDFMLIATIPDGLLVKSGEISEVANDVNMSHIGMSGDEKDPGFYIPGSSVKGLFRAYAENIALLSGMNEDRANLLITELFGTDNKQDQKPKKRKAGKISFRDVRIEHPKTVLHSRIKIDRWTGGVIETAKMNEQLLSTSDSDNEAICIEIRLADLDDDILVDAAKAFVFLACRDLARGIISLGSGNSQGLGRLHGKELIADGKRFVVTNGRIDALDQGSKDIDMLKGWLKTLKDLGDSVDPTMVAWWKHFEGDDEKGVNDGTK